MKKCIGLTIFCFILGLYFSNSARAQSGSAEQSIVVDNLQRTYKLHLPPSSDRPLPLVLVLHGGGGKAETMEKICSMDQVADKNGFAVVYPQGIGMVFSDGGSDLGKRLPRNDVNFIRGVIKDVSQKANIDQSKVFACGFSNGASMSMRLALEASDVIKAVALVGGGLYVKQQQEHPDVKPMPVLFINGTDDPCHPYKGGESKGPYIKGTIFDGSAHGLCESNDECIAFWCKVNHCNPKGELVKIPHITGDNTSSTYERFAGPNGNDVVSYVVSGGGHCWPGGLQYFPVNLIGKTTYDFSASNAIWRFFAAHGGSR